MNFTRAWDAISLWRQAWFPIWDLVNVVKRCPQSSRVLVSILERFSVKSSCLSSVFWEQTQDFSHMEARLPRQAFEGVSLTLTLVITISIIHPLQVQQSFAHVRRELPWQDESSCQVVSQRNKELCSVFEMWCDLSAVLPSQQTESWPSPPLLAEDQLSSPGLMRAASLGSWISGCQLFPKFKFGPIWLLFGSCAHDGTDHHGTPEWLQRCESCERSRSQPKEREHQSEARDQDLQRRHFRGRRHNVFQFRSANMALLLLFMKMHEFLTLTLCPPAPAVASWTWVVVSPPSCNLLPSPLKAQDQGSTIYSTCHGGRKESKSGWIDCSCLTSLIKTKTWCSPPPASSCQC